MKKGCWGVFVAINEAGLISRFTFFFFEFVGICFSS
jgi:hypothetical protein